MDLPGHTQEPGLSFSGTLAFRGLKRTQPERILRIVKMTFLEFFAGIGLMRMGLERRGWTVRWANDIDADKRIMYRAQFPDADQHFVLADVHDLEPSAIPSATLATASFPCNDLSLAGARAGIRDGAQSSAYWGFIEALRGMGSRAPRIVILENVAGFLSSHDGRDFRDALLALNDLDYEVDALLLDAASFVPQSRQRLFVIGVRNASRQEVVEETQPIFYQSDVRPRDVAEFIIGHPEIKWRIRELPPLPRRTKTLADIVVDIPPCDPSWWSADRVAYLLNQMSPKHRATAEGMRNGDSIQFGTVFRRVRNGRSMAELRIDGIAGCLRTPRGGSGRQILLKGGRGEISVRLINAKECARLMGAGDFRISVPLNQALFGFGDAVCVPVVSWLSEHYLEPLLAELSQSTRVRVPA